MPFHSDLVPQIQQIIAVLFLCWQGFYCRFTWCFSVKFLSSGLFSCFSWSVWNKIRCFWNQSGVLWSWKWNGLWEQHCRRVEFCKGTRQSGLVSVWQHTLVGQRWQGFLYGSCSCSVASAKLFHWRVVYLGTKVRMGEVCWKRTRHGAYGWGMLKAYSSVVIAWNHQTIQANKLSSPAPQFQP